MTLQRAVEAFVGGFTFTRSFTYPYEAVRLGPLWVMRDVRPRKDPRVTEIVAANVAPSEALAWIEREDSPRRFVCAIDSPSIPEQAPIRAYKSAGYRLLRREPLMVRPLTPSVERAEPPYPIRRLTTAEDVEWARKETKLRMVLPEHLSANPPIRAYCAAEGERVVGFVRSVSAGRDGWVCSMFTSPDYRRRGIARSLLLRMLDDDRESGLENSVLLASSVGAKLYPCVGYETVGILRLFAPRK